MIKLFTTIIGLLAFAPAYAVEFLPCQRALAGNHVTTPDGVRHELDAGQIVVRGKLEAFWETGMEDQTGWCIFDTDTYENLSANGYDSLHNLDGGARVYILDKNRRRVVHKGVHSEAFEPGTVHLFGRDVPVSPNRPRLVVAADDPRTVISNRLYESHFKRGSSAVAIVRPHPNVLKRLDETLAPLIARYELHQKDDTRFIEVGSGRVHERRMFEAVVQATAEVRDDGRVRVHTADGPMQLVPHDRLYLIAADGAALGEVKIENFPARVSPDDIAKIRSAARVVLIQKGFGGSWAEETDF